MSDSSHLVATVVMVAVVLFLMFSDVLKPDDGYEREPLDNVIVFVTAASCAIASYIVSNALLEAFSTTPSPTPPLADVAQVIIDTSAMPVPEPPPAAAVVLPSTNAATDALSNVTNV